MNEKYDMLDETLKKYSNLMEEIGKVFFMFGCNRWIMKDGKTIENPEWIKRKRQIETGEYKIIEEIEEFECKEDCIFYDEDRCMEGNIPMCRRKHCNYISGKDCHECEYFEGYDY